MEIQRQLLGEHHPDYAETLDAIAGLLEETGELERAGELLRQAVTICETAEQQGWLDVEVYWVILNDQAVFFVRQQESSAPRRSFAAPLELSGQAGYQDGPELRLVRDNLAHALTELATERIERDDLAGAEAACREAWQIQQQISGPAAWLTIEAQWSCEHVQRLQQLPATARHELAQARQLLDDATAALDSGHYEDAERAAQQALNFFQTHLSSTDATVADCLGLLADIQRERAQYQEAGALYQRACEIYAAVFGAADPDRAVLLQRCADVHAATGNTQRTAELYQEAREMTVRVWGQDTYEYALCVASQGNFEWDSGKDSVGPGGVPGCLADLGETGADGKPGLRKHAPLARATATRSRRLLARGTAANAGRRADPETSGRVDVRLRTMPP